ncbi:MAG: hypothetical protein ABFS86_09760 [Planctomycetota bacterium]
MKRGPPATEAGLGLVEMMVAVAILATAILAILSVAAHSIKLDSVNRETALASDAARVRYEQLRALPLLQVLATYNTDPTDDPEGEYTAVGPKAQISRDQAGLDFASTVELPLTKEGELREDAVRPELGLPRDLNGDGVIDDEDHRDDYVILPVAVRVTWTGSSGPREVRLTGVLLP